MKNLHNRGPPGERNSNLLTGSFPTQKKIFEKRRYKYMSFFTSAISILQTLVVAIGAGLGVWGVINLMEGYGNDNPGAKSQGIKQFMAN